MRDCKVSKVPVLSSRTKSPLICSAHLCFALQTALFLNYRSLTAMLPFVETLLDSRKRYTQPLDSLGLFNVADYG